MMEATIIRRGKDKQADTPFAFQFENDALEKFLRDSQGLGDELEFVSLTALGTGYIVRPAGDREGTVVHRSEAIGKPPKSEKK